MREGDDMHDRKLRAREKPDEHERRGHEGDAGGLVEPRSRRELILKQENQNERSEQDEQRADFVTPLAPCPFPERLLAGGRRFRRRTCDIV